MRKTLLALLLIGVLCSVTVFAAGTSEAKSAAKPREVRILLWDSTYNQKFEPQNIKADFEAQYPDYQLVIDRIEYDSLDKQILLAHATGKDYDVIQVNHSSVSQFVAGGVLLPLDSYLASSAIDLSTYAPAAVDVGKIKGVTYGIPFDPDCRILAYNRRILDELGFAPPKTTADMLEIAKAAYAKDYYAMAGQVSKSMFCIYDLGGFMLSYDTQVYKEVNGKYVSQLNTPEALQFVKWAVEMFKYMPKDTNISDTLARSMFAQGKVVMLWWTPSQINSVIPQFANRDELEFSEIPIGPTGAHGSAMGGYLWGIGSGAKNKDGAWAFMEYANTPKVQAMLARGLPADTRAFDYPPFNIPEYNMFRKQLETSKYPVPLTEVFPRVAEVWNRRFSEALLGVISAEEACRLGHAEVQAVLDTIN
ncbi:MAG TPA: sugar ABC transporter substrate-binding protein [Sphaerochaeta sp.]|jgi:ABC-type glycerol-3-phosphate transport system substrate-binding protein|nr:sugar ABC transporter substrate-binding protein [Sphaerochaeta sp.]